MQIGGGDVMCVSWVLNSTQMWYSFLFALMESAFLFCVGCQSLPLARHSLLCHILYNICTHEDCHFRWEWLQWSCFSLPVSHDCRYVCIHLCTARKGSLSVLRCSGRLPLHACRRYQDQATGGCHWPHPLCSLPTIVTMALVWCTGQRR